MLNNPPLSSSLWFLAIIVMIPLILWLIKRSPLGKGLINPGPGGVRLVSSTALSPTQRIVTVEVGEGEEKRWLVLGVTPQAIHTLHTLSVGRAPSATMPLLAKSDAGPVNPRNEAFYQLLKRLRTGEQGEK